MMNIIEQIDKWHEDNREPKRGHLGASQIGRKCPKEIWFSFRWASTDSFPGRMLRLFRHGYTYEPIFIEDLRNIGYTVLTKHRKTAKDIGFSDLDGHFRGSVDGIAKHKTSKKWELLEFKTHSEKSFKRLASTNVSTAKPEHYSQMQIYMHYMKLETALYLAVNKNTDDLYVEAVAYNEDCAEKLIAKADLIINSKNPPQGISKDPTTFNCKFCQHKNVCYRIDNPEFNCRTCKHSSPTIDGTWSCGMHEKILSFDEQLKGCREHEYISALTKEIKSEEMPEGKEEYLNFLYRAQKEMGATVESKQFK